MHAVAVLAYPGMSLFETGIVTEIFGLPRPEFERDWYELTICAPTPGPVPVIGGAVLQPAGGLAELARAQTVIVPGVASVHADPPAAVLEALRAAHDRGARTLSICSGAFALAAAGLLDGRRATTHWRYADVFRARFPHLDLDPDVLYIAEEAERPVWTSAGSAAGLDLCLHVVRSDHGATIANAVARRLVVQPHRDGGQAQFIEAPMPAEAGDDRIAASLAWALAHLREPLTVAGLARQAHMAPRTYLRHFTRATGTSPIRWLLRQRIQASLALLETTDTTIEQVAAAVGFDAPVTFRHHFANAMRTSPSAYRQAFRSRR
ncbi:helix-turn-helix domain-containing protein [Dactylosporangium matsuzakiense]|uniref:AraC family transcriptional regulator n=1 Tax=Dactylosporangium matsuzakiense TaxID=53360 RepID=A0A9W6KII5_9ACTN|nr:helix-turn-helix domain-containing protein [Dactylosporangium matsuzakiense]UWZ43178.1 helix-turn-helix domain-containing protein [Dactylosporangium matsuzakiense]GLL02732.1 AraC family transcriptional regulator [Dactylosporangium matsuzakiense]